MMNVASTSRTPAIEGAIRREATARQAQHNLLPKGHVCRAADERPVMVALPSAKQKLLGRGYLVPENSRCRAITKSGVNEVPKKRTRYGSEP